MTQDRLPHDPKRGEGHDDPIARVLKFAGSRPQPDAARKAAFKKALRTEWHRVIEPDVHAHAKPKRRGVTIAAGIAAIAAVWLITVLLPSRIAQSPVAAQVVGRVVRTEGVAHKTNGIGVIAGEDVHAGTVLDTGDTGRMALALGTDVSLRIDVDSRIIMIGERIVRLERGAVYVDARALHPDKRGSLLIHTPHGDIRDIGTQFEVRARGASFGVRVREGEVLINRSGRGGISGSGGSSDSSVSGAEMTARAGEGLHLDREGRFVRTTIPIFGPEWAWTSAIAPQFQLEGGTVRQFLDWVTREQGWRWRFADSDTTRLAAGIVTHGSLEGYTPEEALAIVLPTCGLSFVRNGDEVVVSFAKE